MEPGQELHLVPGQLEIVPVIAFCLLAGVQAHEENDLVRLLCRGEGLPDQREIYGFIHGEPAADGFAGLGVIARRIEDPIGPGQLLNLGERLVLVVAVHVGAAAAHAVGLYGQTADHGDGFAGLRGQGEDLPPHLSAAPCRRRPPSGNTGGPAPDRPGSRAPGPPEF